MASTTFTLKINHGAVHSLLNSTHGPVAKDLLKKALMIQRRAKQNAPVLTGLLRSSIAYRLGTDGRGLYAQIGSSVNYAAAQELGTYKMAAQPYLRPALFAVMRGSG